LIVADIGRWEQSKGDKDIMKRTPGWVVIIASAILAFGLPGGVFGEGAEEVTVPSEGELKAANEIAGEVEQEKALKEQQQKIEAEKHAKTADKAINEGNYLVAIEELNAAIAADPSNEAYKETLRQTRLSQILASLNNRKFAEAKDLSDKFLADYPGDLQALKFREVAEKELAKPQAPVEEKKEEVPPPPPEAPASVEDLVAEAEDYILKKDYQRALDKLDEAHNLSPYDIAIDKKMKQVREQLTRYSIAYHRAQREELMTEIYDTWARRPRRRVLPEEIEAAPPEREIGAKADIYRKLKTTIPAVEFEDAKLEEVVKYLSQQADVNIVIDPAVFTGYRPTMPYETTTRYPGETLGPSTTPGTGIPGTEGTTFGPTTDVFGPGGTSLTPGVTPGLTPGVTETPTTPSWVPPTQDTGIRISLKNVPLSEVLKYVLRYKNLKYIVEDYAIVVVPVDWVPPEALETEIFRLATTGIGIVERPGLGEGLRPSSSDLSSTGTSPFSRPSSLTGPGTTETTLGGPGEPGATQTIKDFLTQSGVPWPRFGLPGGSNILFNSRTGTLIVMNTPTNMLLVRELVRLWDVPALQVEIEARFVELLHSRWFENSFELGMLSPLRFTSGAKGGAISSATRSSYEVSLNPNQVSRYFPELLPTEFPTADADTFLSLTGIMTKPEFQFVWHAIDQTDWSELLSAPRVTTISGQQAQIEVVQELTYPTEYNTETINVGGGLGGTTNLISGEVFMVTPGNWEKRDVGIILNVTPSVSADGKMITLVLMPEVSDLVKWINYGNEIYPIQQPIFETRNVTTTVHVNDGETIVLGGLITDKTTTYEDKVPLLGSIPFLGRFFRTHAQTSAKANLVIFVTARLITSRGTELAEERAISQAETRRLQEKLRESKEGAGEIAPGVGTTNIIE
jgi:general secretion pathway protein D